MNNLIKKISMFLLLVLCFFSFYNVKADTKNIEVTNISIKDKSSTIAVETPVISSNVITSNVTFNKVNDFVSFDITLKNNEEDKYKIISITDNNTNENIKLDYTYNDNFINKGDSATIGVKLSYIKKLVNQDKISLNDLQITINLENEKGDSGEIIINPTTGDNLYINIGILIISIIALIFIVTKKKIKGIKVGNLLLVLAILLIPFGVLANEKFELKLRFNSIDIKGEFEKYNITIDPKDGNNPITREVTYGEKIGSLPVITKSGYNFNKWIDNNGNEVTEDTVITGPISIEATFTPITYSITYNLDGGSVSSNPESYTIESDDITLNNPSKEGYTFSGWTGSNGETLETLVTITKGSTGDKTYKANYSASQNTSYKVIHKYQNLDLTTYTESVDNLEGATDTEVLAPIKSKIGFVDPTTQKVVIKADGSSEVTYIYLRKTYDFNITDRTYIDSTSTIDGNYPYETEIKVKAIERAGYDFKWSDNVTDLERTITLDKNLSLTPIYTAKTNTKYTVVHKKQKLDLSGYEIADSFIEEGTTDTPVTPEIIDYTGFTSPTTITDTIKGDGSLVIEYLYDRKMYSLSFNNNEYVNSNIIAGSYPYETEVTISPKERAGYTFIRWTDTSEDNPYTFELKYNVTIEPLYDANVNTSYKVIHKTQNIDGTYKEEETEDKNGVTDTPVTPLVKSYTGFTSPTTITDTIKGDGSLVIEYLYTRNKYTLTIETPEYVTLDKSGEYYYEEKVSLSAIEREGYTFAGWSNGESTKDITVTIGAENINIKPLYTANTDTEYTVYHKYRNLDNTTFETETTTHVGTTGETVTAPIKHKIGFVDPDEQIVEIKADGSSEVTYTYNRENYSLNITDRTYLDSSSTSNGSYPFETEINLIATNREGYSFEWSDDVTDLERTFNISSDTVLSLVYTPNTYEVRFNKNFEAATGEMSNQSFTYDEEKKLTANSFVNTGYTFAGWNTKADGTGIDYSNEEEVTNLATSGIVDLYAKWNPNTDTPYTVIYKEQTLDLTDYEEFYTDNLTGTTGTNVKPNVIPNVGFISPDPITDTIKADGSLVIEYLYDRESYEVSFDTDGGTIIPAQTVYFEGLATLPTEPTKDGYNFAGWYTDDSLTTEFDFSTPILGITTIYAKWEKNIPEGIICKKATTLHTSECTQTSGGCNAAGYTASGSKGTTTITFGTISYGSLVAGNAFDCDVNGDGTFDDVYERFYYLRTTTEDNAVLINGYNYEGDNGYGLTESVTYDVAVTYLPKTSEWINVPITFGEYAARFVTMEDLTTATGESSLSSTGALNDYPYLLENTTFVAPKDSGVRTGIWLEIDNNKYYRIHSQNRLVEQKTNSSENVARPVIEIPLQNIEHSSEQVNKWTIDFETNGGEAIDPIIIDEGSSLGVLPTTTKAGHEFAGWYYEPEFINEVKATDTFNYDTTLYAKWNVIAVAEINGTYYNTVQLAMNAVPTDETLTTVNLLKDVTLPSTITLTGTNHELKNILFNLNGFTISYASSNVIKSKARMEITNGTINCSAGSGAIDIESGGNMVINNVTINATGTRQAVYNNGGNLTIKGNSYLQNKEQRAAVHNLNGGTTIIESGTIVSSGTIGAVYNEKGTVIIGTEDNLYDETSPVLQGASYGLATKDNTTTNKIYDGILKGVTAAVDNESRITDTEANAVKVNDVDGNYKILYYTLDSSKYKITLDADGGTLDKSYILVEMGEPVGELPSPTKGIYTFDGWYDEDDNLVDENTIPTKNETYTAKWVYEASDEIVNFSIMNDVMTTYYNNIDTWKNDESTFEDTMKENFNNYGCFSCTAPSYQDCPTPTSSSILCDQPKGYETGITTGLKVYNSDETTKEKGTEVTYATINNGTIYNLIPGETYYWESTSDSNVHGLVKVSGNRRIISSNVRNVRDIGGLEVDVDNDGTADGTLKYGKIFRGAKLSTKTSDADELTKLGITEEVDLRGSSTDAKLPNYVGRTITNYLIYPDTYAANYATLRQALTDTMQDVVSGENIFFHCKIGTDRTGTLAYFLEGLLGVSEEDRLEDYELSFFYGLLNRHRYHDNLSGSQINPRFTTMYNTYPTNQDIYDFYMHGSTNQEADQKLIEDFRNAMINEY